MAMEKEGAVVHPEGERELAVVGGANQTGTVDTFGGMIGCGSHSGQIFENLIEQAVEGCPKGGMRVAEDDD